jgi:hypothetical protein
MARRGMSRFGSATQRSGVSFALTMTGGGIKGLGLKILNFYGAD